MSIVFQYHSNQVSYSAAALSGVEVIRVNHQIVPHSVVSESPRTLSFKVDGNELLLRTAACSDRNNAITVVLIANSEEIDGFDLSFFAAETCAISATAIGYVIKRVHGSRFCKWSGCLVGGFAVRSVGRDVAIIWCSRPLDH